MNASIKLFQIFKKYGGKRFISAGTKAEYFDGEFLDDYQNSTFECYELDKPNPDTVYGEYKNLLNMQLNEIDKKEIEAWFGPEFLTLMVPMKTKKILLIRNKKLH